jgi:hypothetical protein
MEKLSKRKKRMKCGNIMRRRDGKICSSILNSPKKIILLLNSFVLGEWFGF